MTARLSPSAPATAHYEAMRAWVLAERAPVGCPAGLVLLLRQGVAAWLAAGLREQGAPARGPDRPALPTPTLPPACGPGDGLRDGPGDAPLVAVLASMIEHVQHHVNTTCTTRRWHNDQPGP